MTASKCLAVAESITVQITNARQKIKTLDKSIDPLMKSGVSLQDVLKKEGFDVVLSEDEFFLLQSFLLSTAKTVKLRSLYAEMMLLIQKD